MSPHCPVVLTATSPIPSTSCLSPELDGALAHRLLHTLSQRAWGVGRNPFPTNQGKGIGGPSILGDTTPNVDSAPVPGWGLGEEGSPTFQCHVPGPQPQHQVPAVRMRSADVLWLPRECGYPSLQLGKGEGIAP